MFVLTFSKRNIKKIVLFVAGVAIVLIVAILMVNGFGEKSSVDVDGRVSTVAQTEEDVLRFISCLGWETDETPVEIRQVVIPEQFDEVYTNYNEIQLSQGFDLRKYAGVSVKRWTYTIRNYPDTAPEDDFIRINLLVYDNEIIGGDVCSVKLDGFMHGIFKE